MKKKNITYKGKNYNSIKSLCEEKNISYAMVIQRLNKGLTIEEAIDCPKKEHKNGTPIIYKGETYLSIRDLAIKKGIPYHVVLMRLKAGKDIETVIDTPVGELERKNINFKGKNYPTFSKLCKTYNIHPTLVLSRLNMGWSLEDALTKPIRKIKNNYIPKLEYKGKTYPSLKALCDDLNIDYVNTLNRLHRNKTLKEAIETPKRERKVK